MARVWLTLQRGSYVPEAIISLGRAVASSCWTPSCSLLHLGWSRELQLQRPLCEY